MQPGTLQVLQVLTSSLTVALMSCKGSLKIRKINSLKTSAKQHFWKMDAPKMNSNSQNEQVN